MVGLVLEATSHQPGPFDLDRLALDVDTSDHRSSPTRRRCPDTGNRKTALILRLEVTLAADQFRVDDVALLVIDPVGEDPQLHADLRSRHAGSPRKFAGLPEIGDEATERRPEIGDGRTRLTEHGISVKTDGPHRHVRAGFRFGNGSAQSLGNSASSSSCQAISASETAESVAQDQIVRRGLIGPPSFAFVCEELELGGERAPAGLRPAPSAPLRPARRSWPRPDRPGRASVPLDETPLTGAPAALCVLRR